MILMLLVELNIYTINVLKSQYVVLCFFCFNLTFSFYLISNPLQLFNASIDKHQFIDVPKCNQCITVIKKINWL